MRREVSWPAVMVVVAAVAVTVMSGYLLASWPPEPPEAPPLPAVAATPSDGEADATQSPSPTDAGAPTSDGLTMVVLGGSVSARSDASAGPEWPALLGESLGIDVVSEAASGSGYIAPGQGRPFRARVAAVLAHSPDVIVIAGGLNDLGAYPTPRIAAAADDLVRRLAEQAPRAELVVLSPFSPGQPGPLTKELSAELEQVAAGHDATYVDATTWLANGSGLFGEDPDHPTDLGQGRIAERMERALTRRGVIPGSDDAANSGNG